MILYNMQFISFILSIVCFIPAYICFSVKYNDWLRFLRFTYKHPVNYFLFSFLVGFRPNLWWYHWGFNKRRTRIIHGIGSLILGILFLIFSLG